MTQYISFNGSFVPATEAVVTAGNRSFKFGDGLFESMRMIRGELRFAGLHADRLQRGMAALKMEGADQFDEHFLREKAGELVRKNKLGPNARIRATIYREAGGLYAPVNNAAGYVLQATKMDESLYAWLPKGFIAEVYTEITKPVNVLSNFKTCNALIYVMAGLFKESRKLDDVLLLNQNGFLCESMNSNVFVVYQKQIYTPALSEGCIGGVMRSVVMQLARDNGLSVTEAQINPAILKQADEVFVTNASRGIQWIMGLGKKRYFNESSKFLLDKLNAQL